MARSAKSDNFDKFVIIRQGVKPEEQVADACCQRCTAVFRFPVRLGRRHPGASDVYSVNCPWCLKHSNVRHKTDGIVRSDNRLLRDDLIRVLAKICSCAQNHSSDEEAWGPRGSPDLENQMNHVSYVVACLLSEHIDDSVDGDIVINALIGPVKTEVEWRTFIENLVIELEA